MWFESNEFDYERRWPKEFLKKVFIQALSGAHVYGASSRAYLVKLGMPRERITVKGAVVDVERFARVASDRAYSNDANRRLLYIGRLAPEKNVSFLLRSLAAANSRLQGASLLLTIAGTGPLEEQLRRECTDLQIEPNVEFVGYCPQQELPELCKKADFLVLPSVREPWGLTPLEGMACGLPVLVSTQCGCAEDIVTPETGWAFSPWDEKGIVELLTALPAITPERIASMGNAARLRALQYSATACADRIARSLQGMGIAGNQDPLGANS
jgi:glycosyltransferase involved in cell wall biosynthesis